MLHVPLLRAGRPYRSLDRLALTDHADGRPVAEVSLANAGLIRRDLQGDAWSDLQRLPMARILDIFREAARHFVESELPVGAELQSPEDFVRLQSATTGLPFSLCRRNMAKIQTVMAEMEQVLDGLTGGVDLSVLDEGHAHRNGHVVSFAPNTRRFGAVLPANSPGVHALWLPALALKMPVALKPGQREPWTPLRILEALRRAGFPETGFGFYPTDHAGAGTILQSCGRSMMFGSGPTVRPWLGNPGIEIHGPGYSKILLGPDRAEAWPDFMDLMSSSIADNGGRSCVNASGVWTTAHGREIAESLARRLAEIQPLPREHPDAALAAFADPVVARSIDATITSALAAGGVEDVTARFRGPERLVVRDGASYLLPTVLYCESPEHPFANREYLFPFASVVQAGAEDLLAHIGPTLSLTALTDDPGLTSALMARDDIGRLNLGPVPTTTIQWDQPHEGNLFALLYRQRAFQREPFAVANAI